MTIMGSILSVSKSQTHEFSKNTTNTITLVKGEGVDGDAHKGITVKHRSRVSKDPTQPNLRQVHLIHNELIETLKHSGFAVKPAIMGENITTVGIDLLSLPKGAVLKIGATAQIEITGLRNPCPQLDNYQKGLTAAVLDRDKHGNLIRKAGIMGIVLESGTVTIDDNIEVVMPPKPHKPLLPV